MNFDRHQRVLWLSQVRSVPYRERVELAAEHGSGTISTSPADYDRTRESGLTLAKIKSIAADNEFKLSYLDPMAFWVPDGLLSEGTKT